MLKFLSISLIFILILISCPSIFADPITLKNGDRLTGKIIKKDGDSIVIKTKAAGEVKILWSAVEKLVSDDALNIKLADRQFIKGVTRNSAELLFGDELKYSFNDRTSLEQRFKVYPGVSDFGTFRSLLDASLVTDLNDRISWQVTVGNRFNSNPVGDAEKNDLLFSTGLRATFGKKKNK